jgi:hypothetical protein
MRQLARQIKGLDQAGGAELAQIDCTGQGFRRGRRQARQEFGALGFGDGGAGFGFALGGEEVGGCS